MSKAYRNVRLKSLKLLYDSCVQLNITDIGLLEMEQVETILKNFPETSQRSILGECRRDAFMQQEQIQWEANVWYLERLHLGKHRIDESKSLISISFMEVKEIQNREILQAYMKYELGITDRQSARLYEDLYVLEILLNCWNKKRYWRFMQLSRSKKVCRRLARTGNTGKGI